MINKLLLNNQIISNKKKIQQARVQTINKLVQKIRKLKDLSKKYPDKANINSNLTKIPLILACVKKLKASDIIRKVLTLHKKPAAVLTNGQAKPEDVAVALLATNKIIDDITSTLKLTLHLNDTNPGWKNEIMELSKKKRFLLKNAERKQQKKSVNKFKTPSPKTKPTWKEENVDDNGTDSTKAPEDVVQSNGWKVEPVEKILESASEPARKTPKTVSKPRVELQKTERTLEAIYDGSPPERSPSPVDQKTVTTIDSFFFTTSGDNYVSSVAFKEKQPDGPNDGLDRRERRKHQRRSYHNDDRQMRPSYNKRRSDVPQSNPRLREKPFERQQSLHPSWAAKQKMNPAAVEFKGRKITFGDDSTEGNLGKSSEKRSKKSNTPAQTPDQSSEKLHPSWAAKQKLKPTITEFKGTKITFDD